MDISAKTQRSLLKLQLGLNFDELLSNLLHLAPATLMQCDFLWACRGSGFMDYVNKRGEVPFPTLKSLQRKKGRFCWSPFKLEGARP
jgi:hypothetical protein